MKNFNYFNKISRYLPRPKKKFTSDITYGILDSGSCLLTYVVDQLHESSKKISIIEHLSRYIKKGSPAPAAAAYLWQIKVMVSVESVILIDDSDIVNRMAINSNPLNCQRWFQSTSTKMFTKKAVM